MGQTCIDMGIQNVLIASDDCGTDRAGYVFPGEPFHPRTSFLIFLDHFLQLCTTLFSVALNVLDGSGRLFQRI
jgi:hypothetical protein